MTLYKESWAGKKQKKASKRQDLNPQPLNWLGWVGTLPSVLQRLPNCYKHRSMMYSWTTLSWTLYKAIVESWARNK